MKVRLHNKETDDFKQHDIFMGDLPLMTETGTFVINGAERVIVSQLVRSPGIYYAISHDKIGKKLYSCTVIPNHGWSTRQTPTMYSMFVLTVQERFLLLYLSELLALEPMLKLRNYSEKSLRF